MIRNIHSFTWKLPKLRKRQTAACDVSALLCPLHLRQVFFHTQILRHPPICAQNGTEFLCFVAWMNIFHPLSAGPCLLLSGVFIC